MTGLPTGARGRTLAVAILLLVLAAAWLAVAAPLLDWHARRSDMLMRERTLAARMESVAATMPQLRVQAEGVSAGPAPRALLEGTSDSIAGAALQGQLDELVRGAGNSLASAELLPAEAAGAYRRIGLRLSLSGTWSGLIALFEAVESATPRMLIDDLQLRPAPSVTAGADQPIAATFTVIAFRAAAAE